MLTESSNRFVCAASVRHAVIRRTTSKQTSVRVHRREENNNILWLLIWVRIHMSVLVFFESPTKIDIWCDHLVSKSSSAFEQQIHDHENSKNENNKYKSAGANRYTIETRRVDFFINFDARLRCENHLNLVVRAMSVKRVKQNTTFAWFCQHTLIFLARIHCFGSIYYIILFFARRLVWQSKQTGFFVLKICEIEK